MSSQLTQQPQDLENEFRNLQAQYNSIKNEARLIQNSLGNAANPNEKTRKRNELVKNSNNCEDIKPFFHHYCVFAQLALTEHRFTILDISAPLDSRGIDAVACFANDERFSESTLFTEPSYTNIAQNNNPLQASKSLSKLMQRTLKPHRQRLSWT